MIPKTLKTLALAIILAGAVGAGITRAQEDKYAKLRAQKPPDVVGSWTGDWGMYSPPTKSGEVSAALKKMQYPDACKQLDCVVEKLEDGKFQATFQGECGRPYKYTIKMLGRAAGPSVMFQGTADLGEKDGGTFDWIGRANDTEFVGFFTSMAYTGLSGSPESSRSTVARPHARNFWQCN